MKLASPVFESNTPIPSKYTCDGDNVNPPLFIREVPPNTQSMVLIVDDPDAPMGTWVHWLLFNIYSKTRRIEENSVPQGAIQGETSFGKPGYGGPCPPGGTHRYFFKLYALDTKLSVSSKATKEAIETLMEDHILAKADLLGTYSRGESNPSL